jgi:hypothetical protein
VYFSKSKSGISVVVLWKMINICFKVYTVLCLTPMVSKLNILFHTAPQRVAKQKNTLARYKSYQIFFVCPKSDPNRPSNKKGLVRGK